MAINKDKVCGYCKKPMGNSLHCVRIGTKRYYLHAGCYNKILKDAICLK